MAKKSKLSGKKYFYWLGQIHFEQGTEMMYWNMNKSKWPKWAKNAYWSAIT